MAEDADFVTCNQCGHNVPRTRFCIRCGHTLDDEYRGERVRRKDAYAANPDEPVRAVAFTSTLFPQLPRADMHVFRNALMLGVALVIVLAIVGAFPLAVSTAAVLVPLLMVLYLWDVDVYEDEPRIVLGATMLWGAVMGAISSVVIHSLPASSGSFGFDPSAVVLGGVVVPLVAGALMLIGPLFLLRWRRFNDVLDGATFGAASAVAFVGAKLLVDSTSMWSGGLRPGGDPGQWVVKLISLGILEPLIAAGAIGAVAGAFWLRYRAPVADRHGLGLIGNPFVALLAGAVLLVASGLARTALNANLTLAVELVVLVLALLWLRTVIHFGLLEEANEVEIGPVIRCPNCGADTPHHTFCGNCGISLAALPRRAHGHSKAEQAPTPTAPGEADPS
jgi:ribosomal protein L32